MLWQGKFDSNGSPTLAFHLSVDASVSGVEVTGIIDTGFTGFVLLPAPYLLSLGLTPKSAMELTLADDSVCIGLLAEAYVSLDKDIGRTGIVTLEQGCKEILIGMDFLRQFGLALAVFTNAISLFDEGELRAIISEAEPRRLESGVAAALDEQRTEAADSRLTALMESEAALRKSLVEKEVLLREIHHRVKNNLQIVSSLLSLQSSHTNDPRVIAMFEESRGRVKAIALIHERLYTSDDFAEINLFAYLRRLADDIVSAYQRTGLEVAVDIVGDLGLLPVDTAMSCALLINELLTNALKHAFIGRTLGRVRIGVDAEGAKAARITVADDGVGFPASLDFRQTSSFGMELVLTLATQLNGTVDLVVDRGSTFTVRFPLPE